MNHSPPTPTPAVALAAAIALAAGALYAALPVERISGDNVAQVMTAVSLLEGEAGLLDRIVPRFAELGLPTRVYLLPSALGGWVAPYAPGTALLLAPAIAAGRAAGCPERWLLGTGLAHLAAAAACGLAVGLVWLAARRLGGRGPAAAATAALAVASPVLSLLAREPWQHTVLQPIGAGMLLLAAGGLDRPWRWTAEGALAGLAILVRPTAALLVVPWGVWAVARGRRAAVALAMGAFPGVAAIAGWNWVHFGAPWRAGQLLLPMARLGEGGVAAPNPLAAAAGLLASPGAGLVLYFPAALAALLTVGRHRLPPPARAPARLCWATALLALLAATWYREWWGGWGYGPRYLTDALPHLAILAALGLTAARATGPRRWRWVRAGFAASVLLGAAVNGAGRLVDPYGPRGWAAVHQVDRNPEVLWSLAEAPPLHAVRTWWRSGRGDGGNR